MSRKIEKLDKLNVYSKKDRIIITPADNLGLKNIDYAKKFPYISMYIMKWDRKDMRPTLDMISVPEDEQGKGWGLKLIKEMYNVSKKRNWKEVWFSNFNKPFWAKMVKKHKNIWANNNFGIIKVL